ncbi:L-rhamnose mutarotase [Actinomycetes bacterium]|nr:L-rhamnose mutarotase [Actinomycetes bacterium]
MERLCFLIHLFEGGEEEYDQRHENIWPEMEDAVVAAGFRNYSLFRLGTLAIGYAECEPDVETVLRKMATFDVEHKWNSSLITVIKNSDGDNGGLINVPEVWHLKVKKSLK